MSKGISKAAGIAMAVCMAGGLAAWWMVREGGEARSGVGGPTVLATAAPRGSAAAVADAPAPVDGEPTPEELDKLTTATGEVVRADGSRVAIRSVDGEFGRLAAELNEPVRVRVWLRGADTSRPVWVEADNGGCLEGRAGSLLADCDADGGIEFSYALGGNTGKYTLMLSQGARQELLEFWVGKETPMGQPGPVRVFKPTPA